jgi:hypothetical protein
MPPILAEDRMEERRTLRPLLINLDLLLETFGLIEGLPARRADDQALREAVREARPAIAKLRAVVERMEGGTDERAAAPRGG